MRTAGKRKGKAQEARMCEGVMREYCEVRLARRHNVRFMLASMKTVKSPVSKFIAETGTTVQVECAKQ